MVSTGGMRSVDIPSNNGMIRLQTEKSVQTRLGLLAVNRLDSPVLGGKTLLNAMPTESALLIQPDDSVLFTVWDLFDPRWRGRQPRWMDVEEDGKTFRIDRLEDNPHPAKVALNAMPVENIDAFFLLDDEGQHDFYWSGNLRYCYDFGRPVQSVRLTDPTGKRKTTFQVGPGFQVRLSAGDGNWITVFKADREGKVSPEIFLPEELQGSTGLCMDFVNDQELSVVEQYYFTAWLAADDLQLLSHFPAGEQTLEYSSGGEGAILFWDDPAIMPVLESVRYPEDNPAVKQIGDTLEITFPSGIQLTFPLKNGMPGGLASMRVGKQLIFQTAPGLGWMPAARISLLQGQSSRLPFNFKWADYRDAALRNRKSSESPPAWKSLWNRTRQTISLADARFIDARSRDDAVILTWDLDTEDGDGKVELIYRSTSREIAGARLHGIDIHARLSGKGLRNAEKISLEFPLLISPGDWQIEQSFREMFEDRLSLIDAPQYPQAIWFGQNQSFAFRTGPGRTVLGMFRKPSWATVSQNTESGRHLYRFDLPLSRGEIRETTPLQWLSIPRGASDQFAANNLWGRFHEDIRAIYLKQNGLRYTPPLPTVTWNVPSEEQLQEDLEYFIKTETYKPWNKSWFYQYAENQLPRALKANIRNIIIQPPWLSDHEKPWKIGSSGHAPWDFIVSPLFGGEEGLKKLVEKAHRNDIKVTLWYPSSFSLHSPLIEKHPDRLTWKINGTPEDFGWGDVLSLNKSLIHQRYVMKKLKRLRQKIPFDGLWMDSWVGLAVPTDYSEPQPVPQLEQAIALQREFSNLGITQLVIEGLAPIARSDAYGDYESYGGAPKREPQIVADVERIRGHEYLLYTIGTGAYLAADTMPIYHRLLASGGLLNIANFDEIELMSEDSQTWLRNINQDYYQVMDKMEYRQLLGDGENWLGTTWTSENSRDTVIFSFATPFRLQLDNGSQVEDVTSGESFIIHNGSFETSPWHTYLLSDDS